MILLLVVAVVVGLLGFVMGVLWATPIDPPPIDPPDPDPDYPFGPRDSYR